jgi:anti-sigma B factor antagonist
MNLQITAMNGGFLLEGELDLSTAKDLSTVLHAATIDGVPLVLDFSAVTFMDSSGLRAILEVSRSLDGSGPLVIDKPTRPVKRVLDLSLPDGAPGLEVRA